MMQNQIPKNHMDIPWHQFTGSDKSLPITQTGLTEKASVIGRTGLMMLSCGTGAWRVRSSMNSLATLLGVTCTADIGLMSIEYTCFDGTDCYSQSLCLTNTGVNTSKLNRLERFVNDFDHECCTMSGEQIHTYLDRSMGFTPHLHLDVHQRLHAAHLHFYSAADLLKCSVPSLVPALEIICGAN